MNVPLAVDRDHVLVRMYNVGFGDCFLLVFPADDRPRKVLLDCGTHRSGPGPVGIREVAARIVEDATEHDGVPRIDVVVGTHRHQDHVSGFEARAWDKVQVSEVWLPWTEHPTDPKARKIRETQSRVAQRLALALEAAGDETGALELARNALTNAAAMETLHEGFAGSPRRRFLPYVTRKRNSFSPGQLPGVLVHAMGPSRDPEVIRDMDPPEGGGFLRLLEEESEDGQSPQPFEREWAIEPEDFRANDELEHLHLADDRLEQIDGLSEVDHFQLAVSLEKAVNGTSLMLMFELGRAFLLFPGDAQWGTWQAALGDQRWSDLIERTVFYKVGHHGSHNATPRRFVEELLAKRRPGPRAKLRDFSAAVSTRHIERWQFIPKEELMKALESTTSSVARSDVRDKPIKNFDFVDELVAETRVPIGPRGPR
jgi:beta-lactamase superfamily II metal-dependent hydrolase